ncbi:hypothetical protein [Paraclostridium bifermentans]|uniref:hypothetical protein n=1 Tax=Paraclostridium bifermentans TaxID=1490 RepID=UPI00374EE6B9
MIELANKYKEISLTIINKLENKDFESTNYLLDMRQQILASVKDTKKFKEKLLKENIIEIDEKIKKMLELSQSDTKEKIKKLNKSKRANITYMNSSKEKLNIFNKSI